VIIVPNHNNVWSNLTNLTETGFHIFDLMVQKRTAGIITFE